MKKIVYVIAVCIIFLASMYNVAFAESVMVSDQQGTFRARVENIIGQKKESFPNAENLVTVQEISAKIISGDMKGETVVIINDVSPMRVGDVFWGQYHTTTSGSSLFAVSDFERRPILVILALLFIIAVLLMGKLQGLRSLISLTLSFLAIFFVLIPLLLAGYPPVLVTVFVGSLVLFSAIVITHGWNRISWIAFFSTLLVVLFTSVFAKLVTSLANMTGFASHEAVYLNFNTGGSLDFVGIFLASIIIGMLGVLDDISVTQVAVVRELYSANSSRSKKEIFTSALRVGKDHVAALVNTLVLAYVGVALPMLLFYSSGGVTSVGQTINSELFASEIIRTILGSLGLIITVPLSTWLAVVTLKNTQGKPLSDDEHIHAHHGHSHHH